MDLLTCLVYLFIIVSCGHLGSSQQYRNQIPSENKPAPNSYVRLSEIPFQNAIRAIATPPRDYVPIHENQQDVPPPPKPQPVRTEPNYNANYYMYPQSYTNAIPQPSVYSSPQSFQYIMMRDYPDQVYNVLHHPAQRNVGYLQGNSQQQSYNPNVLPVQRPKFTYMPVVNNLQSFVPQNYKQQYYQKSNYNTPLHNLIDVTNYQKQISYSGSGKSIPFNNNIQYYAASTSPKVMYVPVRSPRMVPVAESRSYYFPKSNYVSGGFKYVHVD